MNDLGHRDVFIVVLVFNVFIVERCIYNSFSLQCTSTMYLLVVLVFLTVFFIVSRLQYYIISS